MEQPYPTRNGVAVNPQELDLPIFEGVSNIHHHEFTKRNFGGLILFQTFRDLERHQTLLPVLTHNELHRRYAPPEMPTVGQAMNTVMDAMDAGESLRIGSAGTFQLIPITHALIKQIEREYNEVHG